ncbi:MAG: thioredoxin [Candidatus Babeliales bacterium]
MPKTITKDNFQTEVLNATKPVVVDVFAPWCGPCQHMMPTFEEVAQETSDKYILVKLNVDESRELAMQFGVTSIPTLLFFNKGTLQGRHTGYMEKEEILEKIESIFGA